MSGLLICLAIRKVEINKRVGIKSPKYILREDVHNIPLLIPRQREDTSTTTCTQLDCLCTVSRVYRVLSHLLQTFPVFQVIISGNQVIDGFHQDSKYVHNFIPCDLVSGVS